MVRQAGGYDGHKNRFLQLTNVNQAQDGDDAVHDLAAGQAHPSDHIPVSPQPPAAK